MQLDAWYVCGHAYAHVCGHMYMCVCVCIHICTCVFVHAYMHMCVYVHVYGVVCSTLYIRISLCRKLQEQLQCDNSDSEAKKLEEEVCNLQLSKQNLK